jgi:hypothetical protein
MWTLHLLREKTAEEATVAASTANAPTEPPVQQVVDAVFTADDLQQFPALRTRNYWCIQRHQATGV